MENLFSVIFNKSCFFFSFVLYEICSNALSNIYLDNIKELELKVTKLSFNLKNYFMLNKKYIYMCNIYIKKIVNLKNVFKSPLKILRK